MDKETVSTYGFIVIATILLAILLVVASPIGDLLSENVLLKSRTLIYNTGVLDVNNSPRDYGTLIVHYRYQNSSEDFNTYKTTARLNEQCYIDYPEITGYEPVLEGATQIQGKIVLDNIIKDVYIYYQPSTYNVRFILNGGEWDGIPVNGLSYTYGSFISLPSNVIKNGYRFVGWYEDTGFGGEETLNINPDTYGDKIYYAKFALQ